MNPGSLRTLARNERRKMAEVYGNPEGECLRWSMNLLAALHEAGVRDTCIVHGFFKARGFPPHPHSWVEALGLIVDITADQFNHFSPKKQPTVVVSHPSSAEFHKPCRRLRPRWMHADQGMPPV